MSSTTITTYETDWLGSRPVFYNERTGLVSHAITDVIDPSRIELHPEGFNNYLEFGYAVFGQTALVDIKYLPHSTRLTKTAEGSLKEEKLPDIAETLLAHTRSEHDVLEHFAQAIATWEKTTSGTIVLPLSGGFDSRLLAHSLRGNNRVRAFTYGTSYQQSRSFEVINARVLAASLGLSWEQIPLHDFLGRIPNWEEHYSVATHAHGMYQMEFYEAIKNKVGSGTVLSGIIGDAWAGSVKIPPITTTEDVPALGYSHGMHADRGESLIKSGDELKQTYFTTHRTKLLDERWRVIESMRFKIVLLSYLLRTPEHFGFASWSPFLIPEIALSMLSLPLERRQNRQWQRDYFKQHASLNLERHLLKDRKNVLNLTALEETPLPPLDTTVLGPYVKPAYLTWINTTLVGAARTLRHKRLLATPASLLGFFPGLHSLPGRLGLDPYTLKNEESRALNAYLVLHPIQTVLNMRR